MTACTKQSHNYQVTDEPANPLRSNSEGTKSNYEVHMRRFEAHEGWGLLSARGPFVITLAVSRAAIRHQSDAQRFF
jgi:hypothetical protein